MTKFRLLTALSLATMLFASCEKQLEENPAPKSADQSSQVKVELAGNWQLVASKGVVPTPNSADTRVTNLFAMLADCKKDDKLHFESTGELAELPGAVECAVESVEAMAKQTPAKSGSWTLSADGQALTVALGSGQAKEYQVIALSASTLKLRSAGALDKPYTELEYKR